MTAFLGGALQVVVPSHLLAVLALGLLAGQQARSPFVALAAFAIGLIAGSIAVASAIRANPATLGLLVLTLTTAGFVVLAYPVPNWLIAVMGLATGSALALNAPPHEVAIGQAVASQAGFATAATAACALAMTIALLARRPWQRIGVRIVSSWIAASGILVLTLRLFR